MKLGCWKRFIKILAWIVESRVFEIFTIIITIASLFADDIRLFILPKFFDDIYYACVLLNILLFIFEIIVTSLGRKGFFCSFYFLTDIIATLTLFLDLGWLYMAMTGTPNYGGKTAEDYFVYAMEKKNIMIGTRDIQAI